LAIDVVGVFAGDCRQAVKQNFRLNITQSTLINSTHVNPEIIERGSDSDLLLLGLMKTISVDFARFNCRLLLHAQLLMLLNSDEQE